MLSPVPYYLILLCTYFDSSSLKKYCKTSSKPYTAGFIFILRKTYFVKVRHAKWTDISTYLKLKRKEVLMNKVLLFWKLLLITMYLKLIKLIELAKL